MLYVAFPPDVPGFSKVSGDPLSVAVQRSEELGLAGGAEPELVDVKGLAARNIGDQTAHVLEVRIGNPGSGALQHGGQEDLLVSRQGLEGAQLRLAVVVDQANADALVQLLANLGGELRVGLLVGELEEGDLVGLFLAQSLVELGREVEVQVGLEHSWEEWQGFASK